ncbi:MAG: hypothetical protein JWO03_2191 [Bacteroidetes bacterium]|nr:hypothetical protein [Bacteroidota bacterium]
MTKTHTSFTVEEKDGGISDAPFSWRLVAKRLHFQDHRFGCDPVWGEGDARKYNEDAVPLPVDYAAAVKLNEDMKKNWKPTPMPAGFMNYMDLQKEGNERSVVKPESSRRPVSAPEKK